jgi:hypothetical protein
MNAYVLISVLPGDLCKSINKYLADNAVNVIIKQYYIKCLFKTKLTEYFINISPLYRLYNFYPINRLSNFMTIMRLCDKYLTGHEDFTFWFRVYDRIQHTLYLNEDLDNPFISTEQSADLYIILHRWNLKFDNVVTYHRSGHVR